MIKGFEGAKELDRDAIYDVKVDLFAPCALENSITSDTVKRVDAKIVVEGANGPTTPEADKVLQERGVLLCT